MNAVLAWDIGVKTLSCCALTVEPVHVLHWECIDVHAARTSKAKPTVREDAEAVLDCLAGRVDLWQSLPITAVVIEQQPAGGQNRFSSIRMKIVSHVVHAFFYGLRRCPVLFVTPSSKLKGIERTESADDAALRRGGDRRAQAARYRANKAFAVSRVQDLVGDNSTFSDAKKKDDLSDAFLLGYAYLNT